MTVPAPTARTIRVQVGDEYAESVANLLGGMNMWPESACVRVLVADRLRLAQALRVLRDTTAPNGYVENVCVSALADCGIADPPDEDHP